MLRAASRRRAELTIALLSALPLLPALPQPFLQDDINSTYQAAITTSRPLHLLDPWMGGLLRLVPKLYFVLIMLVAGPIPWVFRFANLCLHALNVYLIARIVAERSRERSVGLWAAALYACGLGWYGAPLVQASNVTMIAAVTFLLSSWRLTQRKHRVGAAICLVLAGLCHEGAWAAALFAPFALEADDVPAGRYALAAFLLLLAAASFLPESVGAYCSTVMQYLPFAIVPLNATMSAVTPFSDTVSAVAQVVVAARPWAGYAAVLGLLLLTLKARGAWTVAVAWTVIFTLPFAAAIAFWPQMWPLHWVSRRYLYAPAIGLCWLAALWLMGLSLPARRWIGGAFLAWGLLWTGLTLWGVAHEAYAPRQVEKRAEWVQDMRALGWDVHE